MSEIKGGGPAFPLMDDEDGNIVPGMSKREVYAGLALAGMLANGNFSSLTEKDLLAKHAFGHADEMLKAGES